MNKFNATEIGGLTVHYRPGTCDLDIARSCIVEDEYHIKDLAKPDVVFVDIGAYCGNASQLALSLGMGCIIVEPLSVNVDMIKLNMQNSPHSQIIKGAVGMTQIGWNSQQNNSEVIHRFVGNGCYTQDSKTGEVETVEAVTLEKILEHIPSAHIVKVDCEGGEWAAFKSPESVLNKIKYIVGEFHPIYGSYAQFKELLPMFDDISESLGMKETGTMRIFALERRDS